MPGTQHTDQCVLCLHSSALLRGGGKKKKQTPHFQHSGKCRFLDLHNTTHFKVYTLLLELWQPQPLPPVCHQSDTCTGLHQTVTYAQIQLRSEVSASSLILVTIVTHPSAQALTAGNHADFYFT